jgi:hypothetical protein
MALYKYEGPKLASDTGVGALVLEADEEGKPTKYLEIGQVGELSKKEAEALSDRSKLKEVKPSKGHVYGVGFKASKDAKTAEPGRTGIRGEGGEISIEKAQESSVEKVNQSA